MNARLSRIVSRLSLVSVVALSAGLAACSRAPAEGRTQAATTEVKTSAARGPGHGVFREIEQLDLRVSQRESLADVEENLAADLVPHRETIRQVAETLAAAVEVGKLDPDEARAQRAALVAAATDAKASITLATNEVHDALDAEQRAEIVAKIRAKHEKHRASGEAQEADRRSTLARFAIELGLTPEQRQAIHDGIRDGIDKSFPERKVRREEWEAKSKAFAEAFVRDDFDAEDHDLSGNVEDAIASFTEVAEQAIDISGRVLGDSQREALAAMIRERAAKL